MNLSNGRFGHLFQQLHAFSCPQVQFYASSIEFENLPIAIFYFYHNDLTISFLFSDMH